MDAMAGMGTGKSSGLRGTGYKQVTTPTMSQGTMDLFNKLLGGSSEGISSGLSNLSKMASGDQSTFDQMEAPALRQFSGLQGNFSSKYAGGQGSSSLQNSRFQNAMGGANADFAERLSSNRMGMQQSAIEQLMHLAEHLLGTKTFESSLIPKKPSLLSQILGGIGGLGGKVGGNIGTLALYKKLGLGEDG